MQRVLGIACGVILLEITAILVFPRSATQVAVEKMGSALEKLAALNKMTWIQGPWQAPQAGPAEAPAKGSRSAGSAGLPAQPRCVPLQGNSQDGRSSYCASPAGSTAACDPVRICRGACILLYQQQGLTLRVATSPA